MFIFYMILGKTYNRGEKVNSIFSDLKKKKCFKLATI